MTEAEWLACTDPNVMFRWLLRNRAIDRPRLGLFFVACCARIPPSVADGPGAASTHWTDDDDDFGPVALTDAEHNLAGAVLEAMRTIGSKESEKAALVALIRDIFGNPFRSIPFDPTWRTDTAIALARHMYDTRDFSAMPILADALQDAGCEHEDILNHCRDEKQVHVRGCWVVDLVLGKN
jgi:hypothetical protein